MANARKCDVCGKYYDVPDFGAFDSEPWSNTSMIRALRLVEHKTQRNCGRHEILQFDTCDECLQDVIDYMLSRRAVSGQESTHKVSTIID